MTPLLLYSSESSRVATDLLTDLVDRGIKQDSLRLFVIDGSKALLASQGFTAEKLKIKIKALSLSN